METARTLRRFGILLGIVTLSLLAVFAYLRWAPVSIRYHDEWQAGQEAVVRIERFRSREGRLPTGLAEVGLPDTEAGPIYYQREGEHHYVLWFGTTLGESVKYDSDTRRWE